jgi:hypothetical protein
MIISTDAEKASDRTYHLFIIKTFNKLGLEKNISKKVTCDKLSQSNGE